jgi:hypothetical protein
MKCKECKYWERIPPEERGFWPFNHSEYAGWCRRYPPETHHIFTYVLRETMDNNWCGEFETKGEAVCKLTKDEIVLEGNLIGLPKQHLGHAVGGMKGELC